MSTFNKTTKNPKTGEWEEAIWYDDFFGPHIYGVVFPSDVKGSLTEREVAYNADTTTLETK